MSRGDFISKLQSSLLVLDPNPDDFCESGLGFAKVTDLYTHVATATLDQKAARLQKLVDTTASALRS
jgi:hypothetical protein